MISGEWRIEKKIMGNGSEVSGLSIKVSGMPFTETGKI